MNEPPGRGAGSYVRSIERVWNGLVERAVVLSPKDWALASDWFERGVPLELVTEALEEVGRRQAHLGTQLVDETRHEEGQTHGLDPTPHRPLGPAEWTTQGVQSGA